MHAEIGGVPVLQDREHYEVHGRLSIAGGAVQRGRTSLHRHGALGRERGEKSRDVANVVRHGVQGSSTGVIAGCAMDGICVPDPKGSASSPADVESGEIRGHASGKIVLPGGSLLDVRIDNDSLRQVEKILRCRSRQILVRWKG